MIKHKHCEVIKAWADGAEIEVRLVGTLLWRDTIHPYFDVSHEYRVKPKPVVDYTIVFSEGTIGASFREDVGRLSDWYQAQYLSQQGLVKRTRVDDKVISLEFIPK